jgi:hypothetical protein
LGNVASSVERGVVMDRVAVRSKLIKTIGYDEKTLTLEVEFTNETVYRYRKVPKSLYAMLMEAESIGSAFTQHVKKHPERFPYEWSGGKKDMAKAKEGKGEEDKEEIKITDAAVSALVTRARNIQVRTDLEYAQAVEYVRDLRAMREKVAEGYDEIIKKAHEMHKSAIAKKRSYDDPLATAEASTKLLIAEYFERKEQKRREEEERLTKQLEESVKAQAEEENLKRAQQFAEQGDMDAAARAVDEPFEVPAIPVRVESTVPKVDGASARKGFVVSGVIMSRLVRAVAEGRAPEECLQANMTFLNAQARVYKKTGEIIPGVIVDEETNIAIRK